MMTPNLFNTFDPSTSFNLSLNWLSMLIPCFVPPYMYWASPSRYQMLTFNASKYIIKELKNNTSPSNYKTLMFFLSMFWLIMINNTMGLQPYIFTATSHMTVTLTLAAPLWGALMMFGWINVTSHMFTHLVPLSTPMPLSAFMVIIETSSNMIRPITLSVRLAANMIAGHLLISLLSKISETTPMMFYPTSIIMWSLLTLEYAVAMIQSYVFIILASLYLSEIN